MRVYLALDTHDLALDLRKLKVNLNKAKNLEHRWVPENQWHIPICPLGDIGQSHFQVVDEIISQLLQHHHRFDLKLEGVWAYPTQEHGRLLWIGVQNAKELRHLQAEIIKVLGAHFAESSDEKPFRPHLPVVRLKNFRNVSDIISPFKNADFGKVTIETIVMYEMTSGGAFPTYKKLKAYHLFAPESPVLEGLV